MKPTVSIVVPTYNRAHYLGQAIDSILSQTYTDYEIIVIDDGSTDHTAELVKAMSDPRIRYIFQENQGISGARNTGVQTARGRYIAFLDSDDVWLPDLLQAAVETLDTDPAIGLVYARAQAFDREGTPLPQKTGAPPKFADDPLQSALWGDFVTTITVVVRRELLERVGPFDETMKGNEDWDMWIRLARVSQFRFVDRVLASFRVHAGRTTGGDSEHFCTITEGRFRPLDKAFADPNVPEYILNLKPLAYRNAHIDVACRWISVGETRKALAHMRAALAVAPSPMATLVRIAYSILLSRALNKHRWGVHIVQKGSAARRTMHRFFDR